MLHHPLFLPAHFHPGRRPDSFCSNGFVALRGGRARRDRRHGCKQPHTANTDPQTSKQPPTSHLKHQPHTTTRPTQNHKESESFPSFAPLTITNHPSSSLFHLRHPGALLSLRRGPRHGQLGIHSAHVVQCPQVAAHQLCAPCIIPVIIRAQSRPTSCSAVAFRSISLC